MLLQPLLDSFDIQGVAELIKAGKAQKIVVMAGKYLWGCNDLKFTFQHVQQHSSSCRSVLAASPLGSYYSTVMPPWFLALPAFASLHRCWHQCICGHP